VPDDRTMQGLLVPLLGQLGAGLAADDLEAARGRSAVCCLDAAKVKSICNAPYVQGGA
jgi:hypothetical protein